ASKPLAASLTTSKRANPHVSKTDWIAVILKVKRPFCWQALERRGRRRSPVDRYVILYQNPIMQHRKGPRLHLPIRRILRRVEDDVICLPLARLSTGIHQWRVVPIESAGLAV